MSIICPSCGSSLNQITNSHIRSKHPEFKSITEFKEFFKLDTLWSVEVKSSFVQTMTGKTREPYNLTEKYYNGVKRATEKRTGKQHWNYGNHWNIEEREKIGTRVKSSTKFQEAISRWDDKDYRAQRIDIINHVVVPKQLNTRVQKGLITAFEERSAWNQYQSLVRKYTSESVSKYKHLIDPKNLLNKGTHDLDHKFSKFEGFKRGIPPK